MYVLLSEIVFNRKFCANSLIYCNGARNRLRNDGCVIVEKFYDIEVEVTAEFIEHQWNGVSLQIVDHGRWSGQFLGNAYDLPAYRQQKESDEYKSNEKQVEYNRAFKQDVYDFIYVNHAVEKFLFPLNIPHTSSAPYGTCGVDLAIVRSLDTATGKSQLQVMCTVIPYSVNMILTPILTFDNYIQHR